MSDSEFHNEMHQVAACNDTNDEHIGVDGGVSMKSEALEADLFYQSVQIRR